MFNQGFKVCKTSIRNFSCIYLTISTLFLTVKIRFRIIILLQFEILRFKVLHPNSSYKFILLIFSSIRTLSSAYGKTPRKLILNMTSKLKLELVEEDMSQVKTLMKVFTVIEKITQQNYHF